MSKKYTSADSSMKFHSSTFTDESNYFVEQNDKMFLLAVLMHKNGIVSDAQLKGILQKVKIGKPVYKRTYHCSIDNSWNNDMNYFDILLDIWEMPRRRDHSIIPKPIQSIGLEDMIKYVNLMMNKPRNWCIDYIKAQYVTQVLNYLSYHSMHQYDKVVNHLNQVLPLNEISNVQSFEDFTPDTFGYCCPDCDGPFHAYKYNQWLQTIGHNSKEKITQQFDEYFDKVKKPTYFKK